MLYAGIHCFTLNNTAFNIQVFIVDLKHLQRMFSTRQLNLKGLCWRPLITPSLVQAFSVVVQCNISISYAFMLKYSLLSFVHASTLCRLLSKQLLLLLMFGHIARMPDETDARSIITAPPFENWRRPPGLDWIVQCFTSPPTQYRLYGRRFLQVKRPNQQYLSTEGDATKEISKERKQLNHTYRHTIIDTKKDIHKKHNKSPSLH